MFVKTRLGNSLASSGQDSALSLLGLRFSPFLENQDPISCNGSAVKNRLTLREAWVPSLGQEDPWRRKWQIAPTFLPGKSRGQKNLAGYSPWGGKQLDMTLQLNSDNIMIIIKSKNIITTFLHLVYLQYLVFLVFFFIIWMAVIFFFTLHLLHLFPFLI